MVTTRPRKRAARCRPASRRSLLDTACARGMVLASATLWTAMRARDGREFWGHRDSRGPDARPQRLSIMDAPTSSSGERERMAAYRFGGLEGTLLRLGESGQMSMIG